MRGSPVGFYVFVLNHGSIPACAGEPTLTSKLNNVPMVYPRVCGGAGLAGVLALSRAGLSPRVRGSPSVITCASVVVRSIPACAGEPGKGA